MSACLCASYRFIHSFKLALGLKFGHWQTTTARLHSFSYCIQCTDAPSPYVGSYPFRTWDGGRANAAGGKRTREDMTEVTFANNVALHFAVPNIADEDRTVAQGLHYPQRFV